MNEDLPNYRVRVLRSESPKRNFKGVGVHDNMRRLVLVQIAHIAECGLWIFDACVAKAPLNIIGGHLAPVVMKLHALAKIDGYFGQVWLNNV